MAAKIPVAFDRVKTFCGISEAQNQSGHKKDAMRLVLKAQECVDTMEAEEQPPALLSVAETLEAIGAKSRVSKVVDAAADLSKQHLEYSQTALQRLQEKYAGRRSKTKGSAHRTDRAGTRIQNAKPFLAPD